MKKQISNEEIIQLVSKQWCSTKDIQKLADVGIRQARIIKEQICNELKSKGFIVPPFVVPTELVVKKLSIDIDFIKSFTKKSQD